MLALRFWRSKAGNFATMMAVALIPLLLSAGMAVDYSRYMSAKGHLQSLADAAALSAAAAGLKDEPSILEQADAYIQGNYKPDTIASVSIEKVNLKGDTYEVDLDGNLKTTFLGIANIFSLDVKASALAVRGFTGSIEVALVLDNTTSMAEKDARGVARIDALKSAAGRLVSTLHEDKKASVRIAVVPYANYVNVGTWNRNASWVAVGDDYSVISPPPDDCGVPKTVTRNKCVAWGAGKTCSRVRDGIVEYYTCRDCTKTVRETVTRTQSCKPRVDRYQWFGCVGTRVLGDLRLSDASPSVPYPGFLEKKQLCPVPLTPLTADEGPVQSAIGQMQAGIKNQVLDTYIPAGLVWGLNVLSPTRPFEEGKPYDPDNKDPRKVLVLMTDGENTMRYTMPEGKHEEMTRTGQSGNKIVYSPGQAKKVRADTLALCDNIKARGTEVFSVAFSVDSADSKALLQACASDKDHYFDAGDSAALAAAFSEIAENLKMVRLAR